MSQATIADSTGWRLYATSNSAGGMLPMGSRINEKVPREWKKSLIPKNITSSVSAHAPRAGRPAAQSASALGVNQTAIVTRL